MKVFILTNTAYSQKPPEASQMGVMCVGVYSNLRLAKEKGQFEENRVFGAGAEHLVWRLENEVWVATNLDGIISYMIWEKTLEGLI